MQRRAGSRSNNSKRNTRKELSTKCASDIKKNTLTFFTTIKRPSPPLMTSGKKTKTKSKIKKPLLKMKCWDDTKKNLKKLAKNSKYSSHQKSRKLQNCSTSEKWRNIWSNRKCNRASIQLCLGSEDTGSDLRDGETRKSSLDGQEK